MQICHRTSCKMGTCVITSHSSVRIHSSLLYMTPSSRSLYMVLQLNYTYKVIIQWPAHTLTLIHYSWLQIRWVRMCINCSSTSLWSLAPVTQLACAWTGWLVSLSGHSISRTCVRALACSNAPSVCGQPNMSHYQDSLPRNRDYDSCYRPSWWAATEKTLCRTYNLDGHIPYTTKVWPIFNWNPYLNNPLCHQRIDLTLTPFCNL